MSEREFIEKVRELKPVDLILVQSVADVLLAREKLERNKTEADEVDREGKLVYRE